ncbi:MAG: hypothetical protein IMY71_14430 [Bacteroidetes bacterium]|nr:hypothetical protein [Bacteroidota bacterium]
MKSPISKRVTFVLTAILVYSGFAFFPDNILSWDVFGYYLYLPFTFIYHDLGINNENIIHEIIDKYHNSVTFYQAIKLPAGNYVMKYSMGMSILYSPFFFIGHLFAKLSSYPADGFSLPYQYAIFFGGQVFTVTGIITLRKVLIQFFSDKITAITMVIIVLGTNYFYHSSFHGQNAMSHNFLFTTYAIIIWLTILWHRSQKLKHIIILGIVCSLTILSRPSEIVCLSIPLFWGVWNKETIIEKFYLLVRQKKQVILFLIILLLIGSLQFIYWKIFTGKFLYNSYGANAGEGFEFLRPYTLKVLFSFRKGWLIYTPVMIFSILGLAVLYRKNRAIFFPLLIYFVANLYIVSSWSCWWYAQSFGQRALIQSYPVMAISLGYFLVYLNDKKKNFRIAIYFVLFAFITLNLFQTRQFIHGIINADRMTKDYYFKVFGKTHINEENKKLLLIKRSFDGKETFTNETEYVSKLLQKREFEDLKTGTSTRFVFSGKKSVLLDSSTIYSPVIEASYLDITNQDHAWIRASAYIYPTVDIKTNPFSLVIHFEHNGYAYKYKAFDSEKMNLKLNEWNRVCFDYLTPEVRRKTNNLKVYIWLRGREELFVDDLQVDIFEPTR